MKFSTVALCLVASSEALLTPSSRVVGKKACAVFSRYAPLFAVQQEEDTQTEVRNVINGDSTPINPDAEGLPWWWELVWKLDMMKLGQPGETVTFGDSANVLRTNIEQIYGGFPSLDGCPLAEGALTDIADGTMFIGLQRYQNNYGSPYKLCFGPKSFLVISDPVQAKHVLRDANTNYDKVESLPMHVCCVVKIFSNNGVSKLFKRGSWPKFSNPSWARALFRRTQKPGPSDADRLSLHFTRHG